MEVAQYFQRIHPCLKLSSFISEEPGARAYRGKKFPRPVRPREFEGTRSVGRLAECGEKYQKSDGEDEPGRKLTQRRKGCAFHA